MGSSSSSVLTTFIEVALIVTANNIISRTRTTELPIMLWRQPSSALSTNKGSMHDAGSIKYVAVDHDV